MPEQPVDIAANATRDQLGEALMGKTREVAEDIYYSATSDPITFSRMMTGTWHAEP